jgi:cold shock CspA family protein
MNGTMLWFNRAKGHGFIRTEEGERLLLEEDGLSAGNAFGDKCAGMRVTFDRVESASGAYATSLVIVPEPSASRARLRRR